MGKKIIAAALVCLLLPGGAAAQTATGDLRGVVVEQAAGPLANVQVYVIDETTRVERRARTDRAGRFTVAGLDAGTYRVRATLAGFAETRQEQVRIHPGEAVRSRLELRRAPLPETMTLSPPVATQDPLRPTVTTTLEGTELGYLPLSSRQPLDLLTLSPVVTRDAGNNGLSVLGLPHGLLGLQADGLRMNAGAAREVPYRIAPEMIHELRLNVAGSVAAPPGAATGLLDVVTRAGSRRVGGGAVDRYRDGSLAAPNAVDEALGRAHPSGHAHQFGASLGGPVGTRAVAFVAYDGLRHRDEHRVRLPAPLTSDAAALAGFDRLGTFAAPQPRARQQDLALLRSDVRLGAGHRLGVRYHHLDLREDERAGDERSVSAATSVDRVREQTLAVSLSTSHGRFSHDLRALAGRDRDRRPAQAVPSLLAREGGRLILAVEGGSDRTFAAQRDRFHLADAFMWDAGAGHLVRAGAHAVVDDNEYRLDAHRNGTWVFPTLGDVAAGMPSGPGGRYTQLFGSRDAMSYERRTFAAFLQDTWRVSDALTFDAGVQYAGQADRAPGTAVRTDAARAAGFDIVSRPPDTGTWSPYAGLAWAPASSYVARASFGISHARLPIGTAAAVRAFADDGVALVTFVPDDGDGLPVYPVGLPSSPAAARTLVSGFSSRFTDAEVRHATTSLEWEWMPRSSIIVSYLHASGRHLPRAVERNVGAVQPATIPIIGTGEALPVTRVGPAPAPSLGRIVVFESDAVSTFHSVQLEMRRALHQGFRYRLAYALTRARDTGLTPAFAPETELDQFVYSAHALQTAPAASERRHRFLADAVFFTDTFAAARSGFLEVLLDKWRVGAIYSVQSGRPYSALVSADLDGDGNAFNDIAPETTRHGFRYPKEGRLDARLAREIPLGRLVATASVEVFNALNAFHGREVDPVLYSLSTDGLFTNGFFGDRYSPADTRTLQFGLSIGF